MELHFFEYDGVKYPVLDCRINGEDISLSNDAFSSLAESNPDDRQLKDFDEQVYAFLPDSFFDYYRDCMEHHMEVTDMEIASYMQNAGIDLPEVSDSLKNTIVSKSILPPKVTGKAYKVFYVPDGTTDLFPPMVKNPDGNATPVRLWIDASAPDISSYSKTGRPQVEKGGPGTHTGKGNLSYRPGWHLGEHPVAIQFDKNNSETGVKELLPHDFVWAECEYAADVNYQVEALKNGMTENGRFRHAYAGLQHLPEHGFYKYRTNPDPETEEWVITGSMKVNRLLSGREIDRLLTDAGIPLQKREKGSVSDAFDSWIDAIASDIIRDSKENTDFLDFCSTVREYSKKAYRNLDTVTRSKVDVFLKVQPELLGSGGIKYLTACVKEAVKVESREKNVSVENKTVKKNVRNKDCDGYSR